MARLVAALQAETQSERRYRTGTVSIPDCVRCLYYPLLHRRDWLARHFKRDRCREVAPQSSHDVHRSCRRKGHDNTGEFVLARLTLTKN